MSLVNRNSQTTLNRAIVAGQIPGVIGAPILLDRNPPQEGQFGISAHYKPPGSSIDLGVYFLNYHDKSPVATTVRDTQPHRRALPTNTASAPTGS